MDRAGRHRRRIHALTASEERSPKRWNDACLAAFAETSDIHLVTFDKARAGKSPGSILLQ
jgi:predicted nucleic acid-binding protein